MSEVQGTASRVSMLDDLVESLHASVEELHFEASQDALKKQHSSMAWSSSTSGDSLAAIESVPSALSLVAAKSAALPEPAPVQPVPEAKPLPASD